MSHSITYYDDGSLAQSFPKKIMVRFKIYEHEGKKHIGVHVHGNWVGPGWSANKFQGSTVDYSVPYIDDFDRTAREHDYDYSIGNNLALADYNFFKDNLFKGNPLTIPGAKQWASTWAVGLQGLGRQLGLISKQPNMRSISSFPQKDMPPPGSPRRKRKYGTFSVPPTPRKRTRTSGTYRGGSSKTAQLRLTNGPTPKRIANFSYNGGGGNRTGKRNNFAGKSMPMKFTIQKFKRRSRRKQPKRRARGRDNIIDIQESRGEISNSESVYVGHSIPTSQLLLSMIKRLCKDMYKKAGITIINFNDYTADLSSLNYWRIVFRETQVSATRRSSDVLMFTRTGSPKTYQSACEEMLNGLRIGGSSGMLNQPGLKVDWLISELVTDPATDKKTHALIDLKTYMMDIDFSSSLRVQNVTAASAGTVDTLEKDNITSNPLSVTCYENKRQTNGFYVMHVARNDDMKRFITDEAPFIADEQTGTISVDPDDYGTGVTMAWNFKKPPIPSVFDCAKKGGKKVLPPGGFLTSYVTWSGTHSFHTLMCKLGMYIFQRNEQQQVPLGNVKLYGMEHFMKNGTGDADVSIQHQTTWKFTLGSHYLKQRTQPTVSVI